VIVKHNNPCGVAVATTTLEAYQRAFACDPTSAFGGVIVLNRRVDKLTAAAIHEQFAEIVLARGFDDDALEVFADKPNVRILDDRERRLDVVYEQAFRQVIGGVLVQDRDASNEDREEMQVVSERRPSEEEWSELLFAWRVCKHVKSNAIVLARDGATIGLGAGQMSRVDSVRIAIEKSQSPVPGSVLASDAYFPFPDGPEIALEQGVTAIIQPGGSIRDPQVVEAVDRAGAAMVFTNRRHFRH
jgi:phosphoribosylaminoimidazolecarboxamide formyltransferase/IMP cyclohydrolase